MSLHARSAIVDAVAQALGGLVTTGVVTAVRAGRQAPLPVAQAPFLLVYGRQERSASLTMGGKRRKLERELVVAVEIVLASAGDEDDGVDEIAVEIEIALAEDPTLGGAAKDLVLSSTAIGAAAEGETRLGHARLEFAVLYHTLANAPDLDQLNFTVARNSQFAVLI